MDTAPVWANQLFNAFRLSDRSGVAHSLRPFAFAFAFVGAGAVAGLFTPVEAGLFIFFLILLPFLNAIADMLSLAATRWFLSRLAPTPKPDIQTPPERASLSIILIQIALDLCVAAICLALLLGLTIGALEVWGIVSPDSLPLDWRTHWADVQADWTQGFALYLMALTTLLPTAIHATAGLGAVLTHQSRLTRRVAAKLKAAQNRASRLKRESMGSHVA